MPGRVKKIERTIRTTMLRRTAYFDRKTVDVKKRTVELAFSSEQPVARWFGNEILDHSPGSVRLKRLKKTGPLLMGHDSVKHVGTVKDATIDSDRVGRAIVRFGQGPERDEILQDIEDGIRKCVSVGYRIHRMKLEEQSDDEPDVYRAIDWEPYEVSLVSMPADTDVGVGREAREWQSGDSGEHQTIIVELPAREQRTMKFDTAGNPIAETEEDRAAIANGTAVRQDGSPYVAPVASPAPVVAPVVAAAPAPLNADDIRQAELVRINLITEVGLKYGQPELAKKCVDEFKSVAEFNALLLDAMDAKRLDAATASPEANNIGLTDDEARSFSFLRLFRAKSFGGDFPAFIEEAAFEREVTEAAAKAVVAENRTVRGTVIPNDVLLVTNRDALTARNIANVNAAIASLPIAQQRVLTQAVAGASTIAEDLLSGSFIDLLRNRMILTALGVTMLSGLQGDVAIPRLSGGGTAFWLATDETDVTEATQTLDQVTLIPRNVGAMSVFTRQLMMQSSVAIEALVRGDIATVLAIAIDLAGLYGTGSSGQPTGVANTSGVGAPGSFAAAVPTFAEVISMETVVAQANALVDSLAYAVDTGMRGSLKSAEKIATTGQFIWEQGNTLNGHRTEVSNQVTAGDVFFGNWSDLLQGQWGGLDVLIDPYTLSARANTRVIAFWTTDFAVRHPASFSFENDA